MKPQVLYIFDPLCGWCYGFSEVIYQLYQNHQKEIDFIPIVGGMVTGERISTGSKIYDTIAPSLPRLEATTGCTISTTYIEQILKSKVILLNSEPPCRAVMTIRQLAPAVAMDFVKALQFAHFGRGKDYNIESTYAALLPQFEINEQAFFSLYSSPEVKSHVQQEFDWVKQARIGGFPCVVVDINDSLTMIANGYTPYGELETRLLQLLSQ